MILDFKRQTCASIGDFLVRLGKRNRIFSIHFMISDNSIDSRHFYIYAVKHEIAVVCIDQACPSYNEREETVSEDYLDINPPMYTSGEKQRQSPVFQLRQLLGTLEDRLYAQWGEEMPRLWGVLVTDSVFTNKYDFIFRWDRMAVTVFDRQDNMLMFDSLPTNSNDRLPGAAYAQKFRELFSEDTIVENPTEVSYGVIDFDDNEFEQMLSDFIKREY